MDLRQKSLSPAAKFLEIIRNATAELHREAQTKRQQNDVRFAHHLFVWDGNGANETDDQLVRILMLILTVEALRGTRLELTAELYRVNQTWMLETQAYQERDDDYLTHEYLVDEQRRARSLASLARHVDQAIERLVAVTRQSATGQLEILPNDRPDVLITDPEDHDEPSAVAAFVLALNRANGFLANLTRTLTVAEGYPIAHVLISADPEALLDKRLVCMVAHTAPEDDCVRWAFELDWRAERWVVTTTLSRRVRGGAADDILRQARAGDLTELPAVIDALDALVSELVTWRA